MPFHPTTPVTPMQLAAAGCSLETGAALLKLRRGCSLKTARKAMREALYAAQRPVAERLSAGLTKTVLDQLGVPNGPIIVGTGYYHQADGEDTKGNATAWSATQNRDAIVPWFQRG